jgi:hypothetical protein
VGCYIGIDTDCPAKSGNIGVDLSYKSALHAANFSLRNLIAISNVCSMQVNSIVFSINPIENPAPVSDPTVL